MDTILVFVWAAVTQYRMGSFTINRFISHSSRDWKSELRAPAWMGEGLFQVADFLLYLDGWRGKQALWSLFYKALIPFMRALPHDLITPKGPTS